MLKPMMKIKQIQGLFNKFDNTRKLENYMRMEKWINESPNQQGNVSDSL